MFEIADGCNIDPTARIDVERGAIGPGAVIRSDVVIEGTEVWIGRNAFLNRGAWIGGGSSGDPGARFEAGDFLHMGWNSHINIARGVKVGHEFGCGVETKVFTHGAYLSAWDGFPVQWEPVEIGDRVWLPNAWVNPGVSFGSDIVVAAGSVVVSDLPSGCLAGGIPAKVLREGCYPRDLSDEERRALLERVLRESCEILGSAVEGEVEGPDRLRVEDVVIDVRRRTVEGPATPESQQVLEQLRRNGIRFRYEDVGGVWGPWRPWTPRVRSDVG